MKKRQAKYYIDDTVMQSQNKGQMFSIIHEYHDLLGKTGLKAAPEKTYLFRKKVKFSGHVFSSEGIQPIAERVKHQKDLESPECKGDVMKVLGCFGYYGWLHQKTPHGQQMFYDLIRNLTSLHWTEEHEKIFQTIKDRISEDTILAIPSTEYPFHIHVDSSNVGTGCNLIQPFFRRERDHIL